MNEDETAIRALIEERAAAMRDRDSARSVATLAEDVVALELAPPLALAPESARDEAGLAAWLAGWDGPVGIEIRDLHVEAAGDVGWSRSLNRLHGVLKAAARSTCGCDRRSGSAGSTGHGKSRTATAPSRSTWMAASAPPPTFHRMAPSVGPLAKRRRGASAYQLR